MKLAGTAPHLFTETAPGTSGHDRLGEPGLGHAFNEYRDEVPDRATREPFVGGVHGALYDLRCKVGE